MSVSIRFGLSIPTQVTPDRDPVRTARRAEELGFDFVSSSDHPGFSEPSNETWTLLTWIAAATNRIHIGTRVLGVPFRLPALTAKMAETLHRLSGDRLILGLGGGSADDELCAYGAGSPSPRDKVDGLTEAIHIIRALWREPSVTFAGRIYRTADARLEPKPGSAPPIWLGTYGPRALALTGRLADGWIPSYGLVPPDAVAPMRERILTAAADAGRDATDITCAYHIQVSVGADADDPAIVSGSPARIAEQLAGFTGLGFTALSLAITGPEPDRQLDQLGTEVLPAVRSAV